jgi:ectoine hydroxylase-related dioxygenase (phytanoyl-CoA dioxygenase family)
MPDDFARDGFVVVEGFLDDSQVELLRDRFHRLFAQEYETGIRPDEVKWIEGRDAADVTRQVCNGWKADRPFAREILSERIGRHAAGLMGWDGVRILQDVCIWRPAGAGFLPMHRDGTRLAYVAPPESVTCWLALDSTSLDSGAITYAAGSHRWPASPPGRYRVERADDWLEPAQRVLPDGRSLDLVRVEVEAGGAVFHRYDTFHGYGPNSDGADSRGVIIHFARADARFHPTAADPVYSRYRRFDDTTMDESFFPIVWTRDGSRSSWLHDLAGQT